MRKSISLRTLIATTLLAFAPAAQAQEDPVAKGTTIAREWERHNRGFGDFKAEMKMILINAAGASTERTMRLSVLEVPDENEGDKSLIVFDHPADVRGTKVLTHSHILTPDDQWLFLPAMKRVKRISSGNKSGPFLGSEFAYEDIASQEFSKYSYRWLRDEPCGDVTCFVVESRPLYEKSGYTRLVTWYDDRYRIRRVEYFDRKNARLKVQIPSGYKRYLDRFWRATELMMENVQTGKKTRLVYESYTFNTGLRDRDFGKNALQRGR